MWAVLIALSVALWAPTIADPEEEEFTKSWMGFLAEHSPDRGALLLSDMNIPGTHDTMTYGSAYTSEHSICQAFTLEEQFNAGYRFVDLRTSCPDLCQNIPKNYQFFHGPGWANYNWRDFHNAAKAFLAAQPSEVIVAMVGHGNHLSNFDYWFTKMIKKLQLRTADGDDIYYFHAGDTTVPKYEDAKGKVVILNKRWGLKREGTDRTQWSYWQQLDPAPAQMLDHPTGSYKAKWPSQREGRRANIKADFTKAIAAHKSGTAADKTHFYRMYANTNSGAKGDGSPLAWAKWLNAYIYGQVLSSLMGMVDGVLPPLIASDDENILGALVLDFPMKSPPRGQNLFFKEIARAIICSNAAVWNNLNANLKAKFKDGFETDYGHFDEVTLRGDGARRKAVNVFMERIPKDESTYPSFYTTPRKHMSNNAVYFCGSNKDSKTCTLTQCATTCAAAASEAHQGSNNLHERLKDVYSYQMARKNLERAQDTFDFAQRVVEELRA